MGQHYSEDDLDRIIAACPGGLPDGQIDVGQVDPEGGGVIPDWKDRRNVLRQGLEEAATHFATEVKWEEGPTPTQSVKKLKAIKASANRLLKALDVQEAGNPDDLPQDILFALTGHAHRTGKEIGGFPNHPPEEWGMRDGRYTDYKGRESLLDAVQGVAWIRDWTHSAVERANIRKHNTEMHIAYGIVAPNRSALDALFGNLAGIWIDVFERDVATSTGKPETETAGQASGAMVLFVAECIAPLQDLGLKMTPEGIRDRIRRMFLDKKKAR